MVIIGKINDELQARKYITKLFCDISERKNRRLLVKYTQATNIEDFVVLFNYIRNIVTKKNAQEVGLL